MGYAVGIAMVVNDLKGRSVPEANVERDLERYVQNTVAATGTSMKRAVCKRIAELTDEYLGMVAAMDCPLLNEDSVSDIPIGQLITWVEGRGSQRYCFSADEMAQLDSNPYTREPLPPDMKAKAARYKELYGNWQYDRYEGAREEYMADAKVYSALWDRLNRGYPVSQTAYKAMPRDAVLELNGLLQDASGAFSRGEALEGDIADSGDVHLALVNKLVNFMQPDDPDFEGKVVLVNEMLSDFTGPPSVGIQ